MSDSTADKMNSLARLTPSESSSSRENIAGNGRGIEACEAASSLGQIKVAQQTMGQISDDQVVKAGAKCCANPDSDGDGM